MQPTADGLLKLQSQGHYCNAASVLFAQAPTSLVVRGGVAIRCMRYESVCARVFTLVLKTTDCTSRHETTLKCEKSSIVIMSLKMAHPVPLKAKCFG